MLMNRVGRLLELSSTRGRYRLGYRNKPKAKKFVADIRHRHPALLSLEGYQDTAVTVPEKYQSLYDEYISSKARTTFTHWGLRNGKLTQEDTSAIGRELKSTRFKFSCRLHDLLRLAETEHYESCMSGSTGTQQLQYISDPDMAVIFVSDIGGDFVWRTLVRLVRDDYEPGRQPKFVHGDRGYGLVFYRTYGNGPTQAIYEAMDKKIRVYQALDLRHYEVDEALTETKVSPTIQNNKFLARPIWTDHYGVGWDKDRRLQIKVLSRGENVQYKKQDVRY